MPLFLCSSYRLTLIMPSANLTNSASSLRSLMVNRGPEMVYYQLFCIQRTLYSEDFPLFFTACLGWLSTGRGEESEINKSWIPPMWTWALGLSGLLIWAEHADCKGGSIQGVWLPVHVCRSQRRHGQHAALPQSAAVVLQCQLFGSGLAGCIPMSWKGLKTADSWVPPLEILIQ